MQLANPFPIEVRVLFMDCWTCWECGSNGQRYGGLELHHIWGRVSGSALNGAVLCKRCHDRVKHTQEERRKYFLKTMGFLLANKEYTGFKLCQRDEEFIRYVWEDIKDLDLSTV